MNSGRMEENIELEEIQIQKSFFQLVEDSNSLHSGILKTLQQILKSDELIRNAKPDDSDLLDNLENLVLLNNSYLTQSLDAIERMNSLKNENSKYRRAIADLEVRCKELEEYKPKFEKSERQIHNLINAKSYKFSRACVEAIKKPGKNTLIFPYRVLKIFTSK